MNIIFLDIDGVIISEEYIREKRRDRDRTCRAGQESSAQWCNPVLVGRLCKIIEAIDGHIVVSSSWKGMGLERVRRILSQTGIPKSAIIDVIPSLPNGTREAEIQTWLRQNDERMRDYRGFVILDDANDMPTLSYRLIKPNPQVGLQDTDVEQAIQMCTAPNNIHSGE